MYLSISINTPHPPTPPTHTYTHTHTHTHTKLLGSVLFHSQSALLLKVISFSFTDGDISMVHSRSHITIPPPSPFAFQPVCLTLQINVSLLPWERDIPRLNPHLQLNSLFHTRHILLLLHPSFSINSKVVYLLTQTVIDTEVSSLGIF